MPARSIGKCYIILDYRNQQALHFYNHAQKCTFKELGVLIRSYKLKIEL